MARRQRLRGEYPRFGVAIGRLSRVAIGIKPAALNDLSRRYSQALPEPARRIAVAFTVPVAARFAGAHTRYLVVGPAAAVGAVLLVFPQRDRGVRRSSPGFLALRSLVSLSPLPGSRYPRVDPLADDQETVQPLDHLRSPDSGVPPLPRRCPVHKRTESLPIYPGNSRQPRGLND